VRHSMALQFAVASTAGTDPDSIDTHTALKDFARPSQKKAAYAFVGVYDGFKGVGCAKYVAEHLHGDIERAEGFKQGDFKKAVDQGYQNLDTAFVAEATKQNDRSGVSAVTVLVELLPDAIKLCVGNIGSTRAVLSRNKKPIELTKCHLGTDPDEEARIVEVGGQVYDGLVMGVCPVTRALGAARLKDLVTGQPYVHQITVSKEDEFVVLGTTPFWAAFPDGAAVARVGELLDTHKYNLKSVCAALVQEAAPKAPADSVTAAVILLHPTPQSLGVADNVTVPGLDDPVSIPAAPPAAPAPPPPEPKKAPPKPPMLDLPTPAASVPAAAAAPASPPKLTLPLPIPASPPKPESARETARSFNGAECHRCKGKGERKWILGLLGHLRTCKKCGGSGKEGN